MASSTITLLITTTNIPQRIAQVKIEEIQQVMQKYVKDNEMVIVVVAPATQ